MKGYTVFNAEQCEDLPAHYTAKAEPPALTPLQRIEHADRFFAATGAVIRHGSDSAFYTPTSHFQRRRADAGVSLLPRRYLVLRRARVR
jgi:antirestriction protein ArdC